MRDDQQVQTQQMQLLQRHQQQRSEVRIPNSRANIYLVKSGHIVRRNPMDAGPTMVLQRQVSTVAMAQKMDSDMASIVPLR